MKKVNSPLIITEGYYDYQRGDNVHDDDEVVTIYQNPVKSIIK